jgi:hypothetical protein
VNPVRFGTGQATPYGRVCATHPRAFCLARMSKIHLNPLLARILIRSKRTLTFRIVKERTAFSTAHRSMSNAELCSSRATDSRSLGGAGRDRTDDLLLAKQALSQLSYSPCIYVGRGGSGWIRTIDPRLIKTVL